MKFTFFLSIVVMSFFACCNPEGGGTVTDPEAADSLKALDLNLIFQATNKTIKDQNLQMKVVHLDFLSPNDSVEYHEINGEVVRISGKFLPENQIIWPIFYLDKGKLYYSRYRVWRSGPEPMAKEVICYLEDGKIIQAKERSIKLQADEAPAGLRSVPLLKSTRSDQELIDEFNPIYEAAMKAIQSSRSNGN